MWTTNEGIELAKELEAIVPQYGYHVALTGGLLYKDGPRKDCDIVLYRDGNREYRLEEMLEAIGQILTFQVAPESMYRVHKATWQGKTVDIFLVENDGPYPQNTLAGQVSITSI